MAKREKIDPSAPPIENNPFENIAKGLGLETSTKGGIPLDSFRKTFESPAFPLAENIDRIILRKERKGHGGKTVTMVEIRTSKILDLKEIAKGIKNKLGCGGRVEKNLIVLQGDIADRVTGYFRELGVKKITS